MQNFRQAQKQKKENTKKSNDGNVDINQKDSTAPMEPQQTQHGADDIHSKNVEQELDKTKGSQDEENGSGECAINQKNELSEETEDTSQSVNEEDKVATGVEADGNKTAAAHLDSGPAMNSELDEIKQKEASSKENQDNVEPISSPSVPVTSGTLTSSTPRLSGDEEVKVAEVTGKEGEKIGACNLGENTEEFKSSDENHGKPEHHGKEDAEEAEYDKEVVANVVGVEGNNKTAAPYLDSDHEGCEQPKESSTSGCHVVGCLNIVTDDAEIAECYQCPAGRIFCKEHTNHIAHTALVLLGIGTREGEDLEKCSTCRNSDPTPDEKCVQCSELVHFFCAQAVSATSFSCKGCLKRLPPKFNIPRPKDSSCPPMFRGETIAHSVNGTHPMNRQQGESVDEIAPKERGFVACISRNGDQLPVRIFWPALNVEDLWLVEPVDNEMYRTLIDDGHLQIVTQLPTIAGTEKTAAPAVLSASGRRKPFKVDDYDVQDRGFFDQDLESAIPGNKRASYPDWFKPYAPGTGETMKRVFDVTLPHVPFELTCILREPNRANMAYLHGTKIALLVNLLSFLNR